MSDQFSNTRIEYALRIVRHHGTLWHLVDSKLEAVLCSRLPGSTIPPAVRLLGIDEAELVVRRHDLLVTEARHATVPAIDARSALDHVAVNPAHVVQESVWA